MALPPIILPKKFCIRATNFTPKTTHVAEETLEGFERTTARRKIPQRCWQSSTEKVSPKQMLSVLNETSVSAYLNAIATHVPPKVSHWLDNNEAIWPRTLSAASEIFETLVKQWLSEGVQEARLWAQKDTATSPSTLGAKIKKISQGKLKATRLSEDEARQIFAAKSKGTMLRAFYVMLGSNGKCRQDLDKVVKKLGHLKDAYIAKSRGKKEAKKLISALKRLDAHSLVDQFTPTKQHEINRSVALLIGEVKSLISKPRLFAEELHQIRKNIRFILGYLKIAKLIAKRYESHNKSPQFHQIQRAIKSISYYNSMVGKLQDTMAAAARSKSSSFEYDSFKFPLPRSFRDLTLSYLDKIIV